MGKIVEEKKKKKKGRPSLLDLQKRNLKQQQLELQKQNPKPNNPYSKPILKTPISVPSPNPNPNSNPNRRFTRRNPNPEGIASGSDKIEAEEDDDDDENDSNGKKREKQLKVVLRLPPNQQNTVNSPSLNSGSYCNDSNGDDDDNGENPHKKRKINGGGDGSAQENGEKGEKHNSTSKSKDTLQGTVLESGPTTPLPDQALLVFILDRLQKKDTYGVFSEPVDPEELPDYHEIIEHPMDFGTVRKKLSSGAYANLEQFEDDVFLICTNAMQYNSSDTIYFRQARSIHELAKKNFENLRQDSDDNEPDHKPEHKPEPKIVRRGRPPTKNLKKPLGRPPIERAGSEFSEATLATGGDDTIWSNSYALRKGPLSDKSASADAFGRTLRGNRNNEGHNNLLVDNRSERDEDFPGFTVKGISMKFGKKQIVLDENRRNTYKLSLQSVGGREPSVLTTFDGEKKQLMAVGLHTEHGFARSLARFAANLGPIAWKVASKKIERALPAGTKFGPGWVGENEALPPQPPPVTTPFQPRALPPQPAPSLPKVSSSTTPCVLESKGEKLSVKHEASFDNSSSDGLPNRTPHPPTMASSSVIPNKSLDPPSEPVQTARGMNYDGGFSLMSNNGGGIRPNPPFQIHQNPGFNRPVNGFSGGLGFNVASQMTKLVRPSRPTMGSFSSQASMQSPMVASVSRSNNNSLQSIPANQPESKDPKLSGTSNTISSGNSFQESSNNGAQAGSGSIHHHPQSTWQGLSLHQKTESVPPDLNVRFQSPGSPNSTVRVDSPQPDLALQL